jgi:type VI secretion system secreted protein Hcp
MASDILLEIDGVKGESKAKADMIDIMSYSWSVTNSGSASAGGGLGSGQSSFGDFQFSTPLSKASPALATKCATGEHIAKVVMHQRKAGGGTDGGKEFYTITLEDVLVSSYAQGANDGGGDPHDSFSFNFSKIKTEYKVQDEKGAMVAGGEFGFDLKTRKPA